MSRVTQTVPWWIIALCLLISLAGIMDHDLWTPDEHREAAIALQMSRTGNVIIPDLAGKPFIEKPPLYYVVASGMLDLLGPVSGNTAALRLTSALWGMGTLLMTWLLARRLMSRECAILSVLVLATMPGFIHVTHWLLIDNALVFFVVAALWSFAEAYEGERRGFLPLAGLFTAGAFLSKGLIGPVVIALGWTGLAIPWMLRTGRRHILMFQTLALHLLAFIVFVCVSLSWVIALRVVGGTELWNEWFWNNQIGRFTGQAVHLGHMQGPFYYLEIAPVYLLPWIVVLVVGLASVIVRIWRREHVSRTWQFLLWWGIGGLLLLSLASTKRDIYLIILLPAFAMMVALVFEAFVSPDKSIGAKRPQQAVHRWVQIFLLIWCIFILVLLALVTAAPVIIHVFSGVAPASGKTVSEMIGEWNMYNSIAVAVIILAVILITRAGIPFLHRCFAVTALTYIMLLLLLCPVVDRVKSYGPAFCELGYGTRTRSETSVALWKADETTRAGFYYYCDLVFPSVSNIVELNSVLEGNHRRFNGVIVCSKNFPPQDTVLPPWSVVMKVRMGPRRVLQWIRGEED